MRQTWWIWAFWLGLTGAGCAFDQDWSYYPRTAGAYFLATDSLGVPYLVSAEDTTYDPQRGAGLGISRLSGLDSRAGTLWLGDGATARAYVWEQGRLQGAEVFDCAPLEPAYLCAGDRYLLVSDTAGRRLGFVSLRDGTVYERPLSGAPGQAVYRSGKFFVPVGPRQVQVWQEVALAVLDSATFTHPVTDIQIEPRTLLWVHTRDSATLYAASLDYNTHQVIAPEAVMSAEQLQRSPYLWQSFGKEILGRVTVQGGLLRPGNQRQVTGIATDFFEGVIYYVQADTLWRYRPQGQETQALGPFPYRLTRGVFLLPPAGS